MRTQDGILRPSDRVFERHRLFGEHIDGSAKPSLQDEIRQGIEVDEVSPGDDDQDTSRANPLHESAVDQPSVRRARRRQHVDDVRLGDEFLEPGGLDAPAEQFFVVQPRVVSENRHSEGVEQRLERACQAPAADEADRPAEQHRRVLAPLVEVSLTARPERTIAAGDVAGCRQSQRQGHLGHDRPERRGAAAHRHIVREAPFVVEVGVVVAPGYFQDCL
jgi:hypothetical protein